MVRLSQLPFPRPTRRETLIDVVANMHKLMAKTGITPDQLVTCAELVRDNTSKIDQARFDPADGPKIPPYNHRQGVDN